MKKVLLTLALAAFAFAANAQEATKVDDGIGVAVEVQVMPNLNGGNWFQMPAIRGRYTLSNGDNVRLTLGFNRHYDNGKVALAIPVREDYATDAAYNAAQATYEHDLNDYAKATWGNFSLGLGYEHFFVKEGRLRPYAGCDLNLTWNFARTHTFNEYGVWTSATDVNWYTTDIVTKGTAVDPVTAIGYDKSFVWGLGAFTGVDFYLYKGLYIGAELNLGVNFEYKGNIVTTTKHTNPALTAERVDEIVRNDAGSNITYAVVPMLRLGWEF
ncbi:MAG: hypothetical protein K6F72_01595 [Bacteroidales bacterium]|nr:hypothetical protein [Bacteroidales bacterium]